MDHRRVGMGVLVGLVGLWAGAALASATPADNCQAAKNKGAGKYAACLQNAEAKLVKTQGACSTTTQLGCYQDYECPASETCVKDMTNYTEAIGKCKTKYQGAWQKAEQKAIDAGTTCSTTGDQTAMDSFITAHSGTVASALESGGVLPTCGDNSINAAGEQCDGSVPGGTTCVSLGFSGGTLACNASCKLDMSGCTVSCGTCGNATRDGLEQCDGSDLGGATCVSLGFASGTLACTGGCAFNISGCHAAAFPATGQTTTYANSDDGQLQAGTTLSYTDNGDGTITDNNTGLMWEKKAMLDSTANGTNPHDADNCYQWAGQCSGNSALCGVDADCPSGQTCGTGTPSGCFVGATIYQWVGGLNAANFAGHNDWRIPNIKELQSIAAYGSINPSVAPAFQGVSCGGGCSDMTSAACSCTQSSYYWSATTYQSFPAYAWVVDFNVGYVFTDGKTSNYYVRAVRGGS